VTEVPVIGIGTGVVLADGKPKPSVHKNSPRRSETRVSDQTYNGGDRDRKGKGQKPAVKRFHVLARVRKVPAIVSKDVPFVKPRTGGIRANRIKVISNILKI
jgi:hypothetical protein